MKKMTKILMTAFMIFSMLPGVNVFADEGNFESKPETVEEFNFKEVCGITEVSPAYENALRNSSPNRIKFVEIILVSLITNATTRLTDMLFDYESDLTPVYNWAMENSVGIEDYLIQSIRVVYDDGCWKPEFPNNPFCARKK